MEKGLPSTRAAAKASALEALLLYVELDVAGPVIEEMLPTLSNKQPKLVAAALAALTALFHNYGCKTADPKPVLKLLPKVFGHADKNVRAEATNLAVEFYRWLREAMKPMFWNDLKPTQQTDLEAQFEKIKAEASPKQERFLRSQQAAMAQSSAATGGRGEEVADEPEEAGEIDAFDLAEPQNVLAKLRADFYDNLASSKWKDRKEALEELYKLLNVPRIQDGDFGEINRSLAKCMKDANIAVVTQAAQCVEVLAKGLRKSYAKYRSTIMQPILDRLKEKKQSVSDALGLALDQVFLATSLSDCLEDILAFLVHKNPQVKEGTLKFLVRCLRTTRDVPSKQEISSMVDSSKKLLAESSEVLRSGGAEALGTIMKIIGERAMNPHMEGLDDIRKAKIKEFYETAEVKAKDKPKPQPAPTARAPPGGPPKKIMGGGATTKKPTLGVKKSAPAPAPLASPPVEPVPASRPTAATGSKLGMPKPLGLKPPQKRTLPGISSPRRPAATPAPPPPVEEEEVLASPPPRSRIGLGRGGLAGRSLAKPVSASTHTSAPASPPPASASAVAASGLTALERAELEELRAANDRLIRQLDEARHDRSKLVSEIQELKNQNAGLIEDHTRDVLSIKAKETQLVRARSDAESAEQTNERLRRELDRLKRALGKAEALNGNHHGPASPGSPSMAVAGMGSPLHDDGIFRDGYAGHALGAADRRRISFASTLSEEKENGDSNSAIHPAHNHQQQQSPLARPGKFSSDMRYAAAGSAVSSGRGSPARGYRNIEDSSTTHHALPRPQISSTTTSTGNPATAGMESWKRAAEVTSQLKARIEQMKVRL